MRRSLLATILLASMVYQFAPSVRAQAPEEALTTSRLNLTMEQRHVIKETIKDMKVAPSATAAISIGEVIPDDIPLLLPPDDAMRKVPQVRAHRFVYTTERILIVDPKNKKIDAIIELD
jgi:hypothetical protein